MSCRNTARRGLVAISTVVLTVLSWTSAAGADDDVTDVQEAATAAEERRDENRDADWMPSIGFNFGFYTQTIDGSTSSSTATITPGTGDSYISPLVGFEGRLYTPLRLDDVPTKPRVFLSSRFHIPLAEDLIAERIEANFNRNNGGPGDDPAFLSNCAVTIPDLNGNPSPGQTCSLRIRNRVTIEEMFSVGLGVDFTLPIFEEQFHIQPSIDYFGMTVESVGEFRRTTAGNPGVNDFIETAATVGDAEFYHAISPAMTLLVDVYEEGPFLWSMWLQGRVMFFMNEPSIRSSSNLGTNQIGFLIEIDDFAPQATMGFHVTYTGKKRGRRR